MVLVGLRQNCCVCAWKWPPGCQDDIAPTAFALCHIASQVYGLQIANTTFVPLMSEQRRLEELYSLTLSTLVPRGCTAGLPGCTPVTTMAVYDWKWYSQLLVSTGTGIARAFL